MSTFDVMAYLTPPARGSEPKLERQNGPGHRRVVEALGRLASELQDDKLKMQAQPENDWRASFVAGQRNVIQHYRTVLATQRMPPAERQAVLDRIGRIEAEIQSLELPVEATRWASAA
jgi:hypothetical protein